MQIIIEYESSWRNSFLSDEKEEGDLKRSFVATSKQLPKNFKEVGITHNTVMGILNRLIGEQKKLFKARQRDDYFFKEIESKVTFFDKSEETSEIVYLRNVSKDSEDPKAFTGIVKAADLSFTSDYSLFLWGVLFLELDEIIKFVLNDERIDLLKFEQRIHPIDIKNRLSSFSGTVNIEGEISRLIEKFEKNLIDFEMKNLEEKINISTIYALLIYWQLNQLRKQYDVSSVLSPQGKLTGISLSGIFTEKDFMARYSSGGKKKSWGSPFLLPSKKFSEPTKMLTKANKGQLEIHLNISKDQARDLEEKIENAGVSSFYLGKKGLAYVTDIR
ncbi:type I-Fv CRISPR-associated protein Cas5fv [Acinetobacter sp. ME22]|uniref:type I-Fv CRISPR-associated protein Cas5fv n=1 Tax=Acinetobacter sp. ME22 TaxID=2904802 RepID=UPI001EDC51D6|nr:type I-Fv CRISPR-associated protein Cas5fv [Acinetobacter sp. ME22]MCG2572869.1 type I-Fv CRISPR-associated protein Cas5fv [Acinetobacter sp. ME22]